VQLTTNVNLMFFFLKKKVIEFEPFIYTHCLIDKVLKKRTIFCCIWLVQRFIIVIEELSLIDVW